MKIRKILAAAAAAVVAVSAMAVTSSAAFVIGEGQAILGFGDSEWKAAGWGKGEGEIPLEHFTLADVTGDGTYTVAVDLSAGYENLVGIEDENTGEMMVYTTAAGIGAMGINLNVNAEDPAYDNVCMNIISVKFDGVETIKEGVVSFTNNEDGGKRANVMNQWSAYDSAKADHITVDSSKASAVLTDFADEWTTCEVTFEVTGMPAAASAPADTSTGTATTPSKDSPDTGVEGIAVIAGLAAVAGGAALISRKRK